ASSTVASIAGEPSRPTRKRPPNSLRSASAARCKGSSPDGPERSHSSASTRPASRESVPQTGNFRDRRDRGSRTTYDPVRRAPAGRRGAPAKSRPASYRIPVPTGRGDPTTTPGGAAMLNVLVVDDYDDAAATLARLVEHLGHAARSTGDGREALRAVETFTPDVCLLDIGLPGLDGWELARRLRERLPGALLAAVPGYGLGVGQDGRRGAATPAPSRPPPRAPAPPGGRPGGAGRGGGGRPPRRPPRPRVAPAGARARRDGGDAANPPSGPAAAHPARPRSGGRDG